jgi:hypothetical protein
MNKTLVFLISFFTYGSIAFAQAPILVQPNQTLSFKAVDVTNPVNGVVTLEFIVEQKRAGAQAPVVTVVEEFDGFSCEVLSVRKISTFSFMNKVRETYHAKTAWYPGQDWSSCAFEINHPEFSKSKVILYVEGYYGTPLAGDFDW